MRCRSLLSALPLAVVASPQAPPVLMPPSVVIPGNSFDNFSAHWNLLYPWGTDHNGGARMEKTQISTSDGVLTLTASPVEGQPPAYNGGIEYPVNYMSGAIHANKTLTTQPGGGYDISAEVKAPVAKGTWPAFWLTAVQGWPPEIDMAEWKGSGKISFNTFNTSSEVMATDITYSDPEEWHTVLTQIRPSSATDVSVKFFMDGKEIVTQYGRNYIGAAMFLIINLQMEGSSGTPGPDGPTVYQIRNVVVTSLNP